MLKGDLVIMGIYLYIFKGSFVRKVIFLRLLLQQVILANIVCICPS